MCGIVGIIQPNNNRIPQARALVQKGLSYISNRGPDHCGLKEYSSNNRLVVFGHTRLAIQDLTENGNQPFSDPSGQWHITFNGEIYNFLELKKELKNLGHSFVSNSDTEVLLHSFIEWGVQCFSKLNGMFAFCIYDQSRKKVWLVRDRFGVKPLLWTMKTSTGLLFSSSTSFIAEEAGAPINTKYCADAIKFKFFETRDRGSPFEGILSVGPGEYLEVDLKAPNIRPKTYVWYDLKKRVEIQKSKLNELSYQGLLYHFSNLLEEAIEIRLRSDVKIALSISGGVDSSSIAGIASKKVKNLHAFNYGSLEVKNSEAPEVEKLCKHVGIQPNYVWASCNKETLDELIRFTLHIQEAPFRGLSVLGQNAIFQEMRKKGFLVALGGQGGDEALAGYRKFGVIALRNFLASGDILRATSMLANVVAMILSEVKSLKVIYDNKNRYFSRDGIQTKLLDLPKIEQNLLGPDSLTLTERQIFDISHFSIPTLLRYEDRNSMGNGVESRLPFLDYKLLEFCLALPVSAKIQQGFGKWILRDFISSSIPKSISFKRQKRGFDIAQPMVTSGLGIALREIISDGKSDISHFLKKGTDVSTVLSDKNLQRDPNLLDEALMLAWLTAPFGDSSRRPMIKLKNE